MPLLTEAQPDALAKTYALSLLELVEAKGGQSLTEDTLGELEDILELARSDAAFSEFLSSLTLAVKHRTDSLKKIFGGRIEALTLNFLLVLNEKGRLSHLPAIVAAYDTIAQERFGRIEVDVFTAEPISADELRGIKERLQSSLGKEAIVHPYTDGSMIGGVKLRIGDQLIDASIATQLRKLRDRLNDHGGSELRARAERIIDDTPEE